MIGKITATVTNKPPRREVFSFPDGGVGTEGLPQGPGHYLAYAFDWGYAACWFVHVMRDSPEHLDYLRSQPADSSSFYIYTAANGDTLTMYFEGATRAGLDTHQVPPRPKEGGRPCVDGYVRWESKFEKESP